MTRSPEDAAGERHVAAEGLGGDVGVAVITGAGRGIGAAVARHLAARGWSLLLTDRCESDPHLPYPLATREDLAAVAAECGERALAFVADVRDQSAMNAAVSLAVARFGRLDAAVAVAGVIAGGPRTWETPEPLWQMQLDVNLTGVWKLLRAAVPALLESPAPRRGRFVAVASTAAERGLPRLGAYAASKAGLLGLVRSAAVELAPEGVTVNAVLPGSTDTDILAASADIYGLRSTADFARQQPVGRLLGPEEIAATIGWLCSVEASAVTGAAVRADGGMNAA